MPKIETAEDVQKHVDNTEKEIKNLKAGFNELNELVNDQLINNQKLRSEGKLSLELKPWSDERNEAFGKSLMSIKQDRNKIITNVASGAGIGDYPKGSNVIPETVGKLGDGLVKDDLGTPLFSDSGDGQYLIGHQYINDIIAEAFYRSELMPKVKRVPMTTGAATYPKLTEGKENRLSFTKVTSDATALTESTMVLTTMDMVADTYSFYVGVHENFLDDNLINFGAFMKEATVDALQRSLDSVFFTEATNGILHASNVNEVIMSGISFSDIDDDDLADMISKLDEKEKRRGAMFWFHPTVLDIVTRIVDAQGRFKFTNYLTGGVPNRILGYDFGQSDELPDSNESTVETPFVCFGNPATLVYGDRLALELKFYSETGYAITHCENFFRARFRASFNVALPKSWVRLVTAAN